MASSQASVEYFLTAGYTHGARIANDVLGLISDIIRGLDVLEHQALGRWPAMSPKGIAKHGERKWSGVAARRMVRSPSFQISARFDP